MTAVPVGVLFAKVREGGPGARHARYESSFARFSLIAASLLPREQPGHTQEPTALVAELFFKLRGFEHLILDEDHFFGMAVRAMPQVLIDHAPVRKSREKLSPEPVPELAVKPKTIAAMVTLTPSSNTWQLCVEGRMIPVVGVVRDVCADPHDS